MVRINWTTQAREDLKSIADYISIDSKQYARLQILRIRNQTHILRNHNYIGRIVPEINKDDFRELIVGRYRIIYKIV
ncbi:MAG: type II toxin-antitoxin system RelE/ParE family toxin [Bacteroidales bacterium]|nr:type II toxin-antitoxin system RelE/ParE family toxin [Bacteroidales bacterium]MCF8457296.1 type II toxin-antitoxin system RelE/ParE family toxin [Bacteroidales bacterium]